MAPDDDKLMIVFRLLSLISAQDLKQPYHLLNKNNEELKRLAAVESLMEVSAEENVSLTFGFPSNERLVLCIF